jgi:DNA-nicking Smr family endonuclease
VDAVAKLHGMSQEEAEAILGDVTAEREALGLPRVSVDMSMVHRRQ